MKHPAIAQIEAYWDALRGDRLAPLRSEVDPRGIDRALEHAFILERIAPGIARFRLAGMHLNDLMGMEVRGMPVTALIAPKDRDQINDALEHVFEEPARLRVRLNGPAQSGTVQTMAELLLLPLRSDLGDISRALGCLVSQGLAGNPPHRFSVESIDIKGLVAHPDEAQTYPRKTPQPPAASLKETQAPYRAPSPAAPQDTARNGTTDRETSAPHLRLVHNSDD